MCKFANIQKNRERNGHKTSVKKKAFCYSHEQEKR